MTLHKKTFFTLALTLFSLMAGCATTIPQKDYTKFRESDPKSILVVPVMNRSVDVNAPDYFLSTISRPVAERGYYAFPVNLVKRVLEDDGLSDADLVHSSDPIRLAELFGADAILYICIERWDARYIVVNTTVTVEFKYILKCGKTGEIIWESSEKMVYSSSQGSSSGNPIADLIVMTVQAAIAKASPNYIPLAQQANHIGVAKLHSGLPAGPYLDEYGKDKDQF
ncbi:MAG: DUF799 domain-containing protein [Candidatus Brocadiales bacterium]